MAADHLAMQGAKIAATMVKLYELILSVITLALYGMINQVVCLRKLYILMQKCKCPKIPQELL